MISDENGIAALKWLTRAFGFKERTRLLGTNGELAHGEMDADGGLIMLATPTTGYQAPKRHRIYCEKAPQWAKVPWVSDGVLVYVDNIDEHYARAKESGAMILSEPEDSPTGRRYRAEDLEGRRWMFAPD
jgi:PhnB protein